MSHVAGGVAMAGVITAAVDHYYPKYRHCRGKIGFWISSAGIILEQGVEVAQHGNCKGQLLDAASHVLGSAIGAFVTDRFILSPVINDFSSRGKSFGLKIQYHF